jgi:hypothetical protein
MGRLRWLPVRPAGIGRAIAKRLGRDRSEQARSPKPRCAVSANRRTSPTSWRSWSPMTAAGSPDRTSAPAAACSDPVGSKSSTDLLSQHLSFVHARATLLSSIRGPRRRAARRRNWGRVCIRDFCLRRRLVPAAHRAALLLSGSTALAAFHDTGGARSRCARVARGGATAREADDRCWHGARRPGGSARAWRCGVDVAAF